MLARQGERRGSNSDGRFGSSAGSRTLIQGENLDLDPARRCTMTIILNGTTYTQPWQAGLTPSSPPPFILPSNGFIMLLRL